MPPKKKQKTGNNSAAPTQEHEEMQRHEQSGGEGLVAQETIDVDNKDSSVNNDDPSLRDTKTIPDHEYIGMHRPRFDYEAENRTLGEDAKEDEAFYDWYNAGFKAENDAGVMLEPAKDHPDHKWVIMWEGHKMFMDYRRRSNYCCPDRFRMDVYNDFEGYGYQELIENFIVEFDKSLKKNDKNALRHTWAIVSAIALWINEVDQHPLMGNENGEKTEAVIGLIGHALIRGLAALDFADQLESDTSFPDIPIVITSLLKFSDGLPEYGIEGDAVSWRRHAAAYFKKGRFSPSRGISNTEAILETAKGGLEAELPKKSNKDTWGWNKMLKAYKQMHGVGAGKIGGTKYDITRMSRKERASHAFNGKDPLADVSEKDLKEGNLDFP